MTRPVRAIIQQPRAVIGHFSFHRGVHPVSYQHSPANGPRGNWQANHVEIPGRFRAGQDGGRSAPEVLALLAVSLHLALPGEAVSAADLVTRFEPSLVPRGPWVLGRREIGVRRQA